MQSFRTMVTTRTEIVQAHWSGGEDQDDSEDSELSDAGPLPQRSLIEAKDVSGLRRKAGNLDGHVVSSSLTAVTNTAQTKRGTVKATKTPGLKPVYQLEAPNASNAKARSNTNDHAKVSRKQADGKSRQRKNRTPARKLPVNELFLVNSPVNYDLLDYESSFHGIETQDPINDQASSLRKRSVSPADWDEGDNESKTQTASLSAFRKYLKKRTRCHKAVNGYHRAKSVYDTWESTVEAGPRGDGFDAFELVIRPQDRLERHRKRRQPVLLGFGPLQLRSGPLPEVEFELTFNELKMKTSHDRFKPDAVYDGDPLGPYDSASEQRPRRRDSSRARAREQMIRAQLSSISAPERVPSESAESEDDVNEEDEDYTHDDNEDQAMHNEQAADSDEEVMEEPELRDPDQPTIVHGHPDRRNQGVTLDFRQRASGQPPRPYLETRCLIEVNEAIVQVPDSEHYHAEYTLEDTPRESPWERSKILEMPIMGK